jgi:uncharacterized membrane protein
MLEPFLLLLLFFCLNFWFGKDFGFPIKLTLLSFIVSFSIFRRTNLLLKMNEYSIDEEEEEVEGKVRRVK